MTAADQPTPDIPDPATEAGARALFACWFGFHDMDLDDAYNAEEYRDGMRAALAAAYPDLTAHAVAAERKRLALLIRQRRNDMEGDAPEGMSDLWAGLVLAQLEAVEALIRTGGTT